MQGANKKHITMNLLKLAKNLEFKTGIEYYDYCITSHYNGQLSQAMDLFKAMSKTDRKGLIEYINGCYDYPEQRDVYKFFFKLL